MTAVNAAELVTLLTQLAQALSRREVERPKVLETRPVPERVLLKVEEAAERLGIGRTTAYSLVKSGELASVRIGNLRRVPVAAINDYAARLSAQQNAA